METISNDRYGNKYHWYRPDIPVLGILAGGLLKLSVTAKHGTETDQSQRRKCNYFTLCDGLHEPARSCVECTVFPLDTEDWHANKAAQVVLITDLGDLNDCHLLSQ